MWDDYPEMRVGRDTLKEFHRTGAGRGRRPTLDSDPVNLVNAREWCLRTESQ
jgi:hypothetical protein